MFDIVGWKQIYNNLYQPLCIEAHQINHMETNIVPQHHKMNFKPFRTFENHILLLDSMLSIMKLSLHRIITIYGDEQHKKNWNIYENKLDSYLTNNHALAQIEKLLDPYIKYFGTNINQSESTCGTGKVQTTENNNYDWRLSYFYLIIIIVDKNGGIYVFYYYK